MDCGCGGGGGDEGPLGELNPDALAPGWSPDLGAGCGCGGGSGCGCGGACNRYGGDAGGEVDFPPVRPVRLAAQDHSEGGAGSDEEPVETVVVDGSPEQEGGSLGGTIRDPFHPIFEAPDIIDLRPIEDVIVQRPPDDDDDGGGGSADGDRIHGSFPWPGGPPWGQFDKTNMGWKAIQCCECLLASESGVGGANSVVEDDVVWVSWCNFQYRTKPRMPLTNEYNNCIEQDSPAEKRNWCINHDVCPRVLPTCQRITVTIPP